MTANTPEQRHAGPNRLVEPADGPSLGGGGLNVQDIALVDGGATPDKHAGVAAGGRDGRTGGGAGKDKDECGDGVVTAIDEGKHALADGGTRLGNNAGTSAPATHSRGSPGASSLAAKLTVGPVMEIPRDELDMRELIGKGAWGKVYRGSWLSTEVAIKKLNKDLSAEAKQQFVDEVRVSAALQHPHIVQVYGGCMDGDPMLMVMEFMSHGSLYKLMQKLAKERRGAPPGAPPLELCTAMDIILQVVKGMVYLHSYGIAHRDLKSLNVLVAGVRENGLLYTVKIGDFGLAKVKHESMTRLNTQVGTFRWMAPEIMRGEPYRTSADVHSFAMLCFEVLTGKVPYAELSNMQVTYAVAQEKQRPHLPLSLPEELRTLLSECWDDDPTRRPTFADILKRLQPLHKTLLLQVRSAAKAKAVADEEKRSKDELARLQAQILGGTDEGGGTRGAAQGTLSPQASAPVGAHGAGDAPPLPPTGPRRSSRSGALGGMDAAAPIKPSRSGVLGPISGGSPSCQTLRGHDDSAMCLAISGDRLFSGGDDATIKVWNLKRNQLSMVLTGHKGGVRALAVGNNRLFSGSVDGTIKVWRLSDLALETTLAGHNGGVTAIVVAGSHNRLFSSADDCTVRIWSLADKFRPLATLKDKRGDYTHALLLATRDGEGRLFCGSNNGYIHEWGLEPRWQLWPPRRRYPLLSEVKAHRQPVSSLAVARGHLYSGSWDGSIKAWDVYSHELVATCEAHGAQVLALAVGNNVLCSASADASIKVWSLQDFRLIATLTGHTGEVLALLSKSSKLYSGSKDSTIKIWDASS